ncbi:hypothetical protein [Varunaivibrio sulfuroxidans]|uniref:UDP:flavonoid glycosyltransferase YjiC (YdhE family) n=1 Tax=Varunaivibrio sulfuroxidans TaxID=1773489 RepID=A0A4R3JFS2_9PROT|nr:hypothetical protein [Varunaivibrio sulfuroxidans]TCS64345.1 hypothetical protein EDD55_102389 [Varunaivibrio sulfuroxidans]WES31218.1 hypothetical protein P3M64_02255 [Varunaivibrio sulfuroxidans]
MATVFLAAEVSTGLDPVNVLLPIANRLRLHGHTPVFVLRDCNRPMVILRQQGFSVLQAPVWRAGRGAPQPDPMAYPDYVHYLVKLGIADGAAITTQVDRWRTLIEFHRPALVVAYDSPGLMIAARGRAPVIALGKEGTLPAITESGRYPTLWGAAAPPAREQGLVHVVNQALAGLGEPEINLLSDITNACVDRFVLDLPQFDFYDDVRRPKAVGPLLSVPGPAAAPSGAGAYVHVKSDVHTVDFLMNALGQFTMPVRAYIEGVSRDFLSAMAWRDVHLLPRPGDGEDEAGKALIVIHDGNPTLAGICLSLGRSQVVLPQTPGQFVIAEKIEKLGVGAVCYGAACQDGAIELVGLALALNPTAWQWAEKMDRRGSLKRVFNACLVATGEKPPSGQTDTGKKQGRRKRR